MMFFVKSHQIFCRCLDIIPKPTIIGLCTVRTTAFLWEAAALILAGGRERVSAHRHCAEEVHRQFQHMVVISKQKGNVQFLTEIHQQLRTHYAKQNWK